MVRLLDAFEDTDWDSKSENVIVWVFSSDFDGVFCKVNVLVRVTENSSLGVMESVIVSLVESLDDIVSL